MLDQFYVERNTRKSGPFSAAQLKEMVVSGRLRATDTVWREGMKKPVLAGQVKKLFPAPQRKTHVLAVSAPLANPATVPATLAAPETDRLTAAALPASPPLDGPAPTSDAKAVSSEAP